MEFLIFVVVVFILCWVHCQNEFKISYYEEKLKNRNVNIKKVENMPFYKLWLN